MDVYITALHIIYIKKKYMYVCVYTYAQREREGEPEGRCESSKLDLYYSTRNPQNDRVIPVEYSNLVNIEDVLIVYVHIYYYTSETPNW